MSKRNPVGRPEVTQSGRGFKVRLGARLRAIRKERGLTLEEAERATGGAVSYSSWGFAERGAEPSLSRALLMALALGITLEELLPVDVLDAFRAKAVSKLNGLLKKDPK